MGIPGICHNQYSTIWQYRLWCFQVRDTKLERFLAKKQHTQRKLVNFENWYNGGGVKNCQHLTFKVNFLCRKSSESFSIFFFIEEYQFRRTFFVTDIF